MDRKRKIKISYHLALVSGIFCCLLTLLLFLNFWNLKQEPSIESASIEKLMDRLNQEPGNEELKKEILNLDLMARKVFFTSCWQIKTGSYLILIAGIVLTISLKSYTDLRTSSEKSEDLTKEILRARTNSHYWIFLGGGLLLGLALSAAYLSNDILKDYQHRWFTVEKLEVNSEIQGVSASSSQDPDKTRDDVLKDTENPILNESEIIIIERSEEQFNSDEKSSQDNAIPPYYGIEDFKRNHNSFRGFFGQGISYHQDIPVNWDGPSGQNIKWKVECRPGTNSPVIWGDKLFISGADAHIRMVSCYQRFSGQLLWEKAVKDIPGSPAKLLKEYPETGLAAPTMVVDGRQVYAIFGNGDLIAFDLEGNKIWSRNLGVPDNPYNHASSLLIWEEKLVIQYDTRLGGRILTINSATGESIWDMRRPVQTSWASPVLIRYNDIIQIITTADPFVGAYDLESGEELWKVEGMSGEVAASVAFNEGLVFANTAFARLLCIKPEPGTAPIWEDDEYLSEVPSPVANDGLLFLPTNYGDLVCYDTKTGEKYWETWLEDEIYSSPVVADGKIYLIDKGGTMHILKADKTGTIINEPELGERALATPAFAEGMIYIRGTSNLYCIAKAKE